MTGFLSQRESNQFEFQSSLTFLIFLNFRKALSGRASWTWIIARPGSLSNGELTGAYWHGTSADNVAISVKISRADVADFMLKQLADDTYLQKSVSISYYKNHSAEALNTGIQ